MKGERGIDVFLDFDSLLFIASTKSNLEEAKEYIVQALGKISSKIEQELETDAMFHLFYKNDRISLRKCVERSYKANRKEKPPLYEEIMKNMHVIAEVLTPSFTLVPVYMLESDDYIAYMASMHEPETRVIASFDKDLQVFEGWFFDLYYKRFELKYISKQEAVKNAVVLLLSGDKSDNIKGVVSENVAKGIVKLYSGFALKRKVAELYKKKYKSKWQFMLRKNIHMLLPLHLLKTNAFNLKT